MLRDIFLLLIPNLLNSLPVKGVSYTIEMIYTMITKFTYYEQFNKFTGNYMKILDLQTYFSLGPSGQAYD